MNETVFFLKDLSEDCVDAIIIASTSTKEEIESAIAKAKEINDYTWGDLLETLPKDCRVYDKWSNEEIHY